MSQRLLLIDQEADALRDRYGRNEWGQACLLARRLAESGTSVVNIYFNTPKTGQEFTNWDDHIGNAGRPGHFAKYMRVRLPYMDQALSALIDDIFTRNLDRRILVVVVGEFGRTPRLSSNTTGTGRNHWAAGLYCFTGRRRTSNGTGRRRDEQQGRVSGRATAHAAGSAGDDLSTPGNRSIVNVNRPLRSSGLHS